MRRLTALLCAILLALPWPALADTDASGKLSANTTCAVNATYCEVFSITPANISAGVGLYVMILVDSDSTLIAPQFRVRSADAGYTGTCTFLVPETTATVVADTIAIAAAPADTGSTDWASDAPTVVQIYCALLADATPGAIVVEWQLETGTSTQTILAGSYWMMIN